MARYSFLFIVLAAGCSEQAGAGDRAKDALDVYETVFRHHLKKEKADVKAYLAIDGKDPPEELFKRLRKDFANLKPISEEPKEKGLQLRIRELKWQRGDRAELNAGYWFPTKFAGQGYYADHHLIREKGTWKIEKLTNEISS